MCGCARTGKSTCAPGPDPPAVPAASGSPLHHFGGVGVQLSSLVGVSTGVGVTACAWGCTSVPCVDAETE